MHTRFRHKSIGQKTTKPSLLPLPLPLRTLLDSDSWKSASLELCRWDLVRLGKHERLGFSESLDVSLAKLASEARALVAAKRSAGQREVLVDLWGQRT